MRIIAGTSKGRKIETPKSMNTRPTLDRVRESMFGILQFKLYGKNVLDLFAGSGALGLEALSREAEFCMFVDSSSEAEACIRKNIATLGYSTKSRFIRSDFAAALLSAKRSGMCFDIIFLDPPYALDYAVKSITMISELSLLADDGIIVLEHAEKDSWQQIGDMRGYDTRKYGEVALTFYQKVQEAKV